MTISSPIHREDIKAEIRKKCGSLLAFEESASLGNRSVTDALLGRRRPSTAKAIAELLGKDVHELFPGIYAESAFADDSNTHAAAHGLNAEAQ